MRIARTKKKKKKKMFAHKKYMHRFKLIKSDINLLFLVNYDNFCIQIKKICFKYSLKIR